MGSRHDIYKAAEALIARHGTSAREYAEQQRLMRAFQHDAAEASAWHQISIAIASLNTFRALGLVH